MDYRQTIRLLRQGGVIGAKVTLPHIFKLETDFTGSFFPQFPHRAWYVWGVKRVSMLVLHQGPQCSLALSFGGSFRLKVKAKEVD
jgi:hypothetical protein